MSGVVYYATSVQCFDPLFYENYHVFNNQENIEQCPFENHHVVNYQNTEENHKIENNNHHVVNNQKTKNNIHFVNNQKTENNNHHFNNQLTKNNFHHFVNDQKTENNNHVVNNQLTKNNIHHVVNNQKTENNNHHVVNNQKTENNNHHFVNNQKTENNNHHVVNNQLTKNNIHHVVNNQKSKNNIHQNINNHITKVEEPEVLPPIPALNPGGDETTTTKKKIIIDLSCCSDDSCYDMDFEERNYRKPKKGKSIKRLKCLQTKKKHLIYRLSLIKFKNRKTIVTDKDGEDNLLEIQALEKKIRDVYDQIFLLQKEICGSNSSYKLRSFGDDFLLRKSKAKEKDNHMTKKVLQLKLKKDFQNKPASKKNRMWFLRNYQRVPQKFIILEDPEEKFKKVNMLVTWKRHPKK